MSDLWTKDRVLSLAPDAASAKAGQAQATPAKWQNLGRSPACLWGEVQGSGQKPYQVRVDLTEPAFKCSCPSRKFPCKHALGLLLILADQPAKLPSVDPPEWVGEWLAGREKRSEARDKKAAAPPKPVDAAAQAARVKKRESNIEAGLDELSRFLVDVLRQGFAAAQSQPTRAWDDVAARLVDAQAPGLARLVRQLGETIGSGPGWHSRLLRGMARMSLAIEGYKRLAELPTDTQHDLRTLIGWTQSKEEVLAQPAVEGPWCVVAQQSEEEDRLLVRRTWLLRQGDGRPAMLLDFAAAGQPLDVSVMVGSLLAAELAFYPSAAPLRAIVKQRTGPLEIFGEIPGVDTSDQALADYAAALSRNPWIERWPMPLAAVTPIPTSVKEGGVTSWQLRDRDGAALPIDSKFSDGWTLLALSGGRPLSVFGEWDGERLAPLGVSVGGTYLSWSKRIGASPLARVS
jgi:hypothetical protein